MLYITSIYYTIIIFSLHNPGVRPFSILQSKESREELVILILGQLVSLFVKSVSKYFIYSLGFPTQIGTVSICFLHRTQIDSGYPHTKERDSPKDLLSLTIYLLSKERKHTWFSLRASATGGRWRSSHLGTKEDTFNE